MEEDRLAGGELERLRAENYRLRQQHETATEWPVGGAPPGSRPTTPSLHPPSTAPHNLAPTPERVYVYAPRDTKCSRFSGDRTRGSSRVEEWIQDVRKALVGQPLTPAEQVTWVVDLLDGEAKREVAFSVDIECAQLDTVFTVLLEHFGCDQTYIAIQRQFFHRRQGERESIREFTHALVTLLEQLQTKDPRVVPLPDMVLRDTFVENICDTKLHQELTQVLRNHPFGLLEIYVIWRCGGSGVKQFLAPLDTEPPPATPQHHLSRNQW